MKIIFGDYNILISIIFLAIVFFCFSGLIFYIVYKYKKDQYSHLEEIEKIKLANQNIILSSQVEIQEQTFQHISKEIHDNISQKLTLVKLYLNTMKIPEEDQAAANLHHSIAVLTQTITDLRSLSGKLNSDLILNHGLIKVIEWEVEKIAKLELFELDYRVTGNEVFLNPQNELILFRIFQEAINNSIKHSGANKIEILLDYEADYLRMTIQDNGKGFQIAQQTLGSGLKNIEQRTKLLKGKFNIDSTEKGTEIRIEVPIGEDV